jgi:exoribonuclease-2
VFRAGDLVGFLDSHGPQLALIHAVQGSKYKINLGFKAKTLVVPKRHLEVIAPLPHGVQPPSRLGGSPWEFSATDLRTNNPSRREWGAAWVLLREVSEKTGLGEFADLVLGSDTPLHRAACWLALHGPQLMFRLRQGEIEARSS